MAATDLMPHTATITRSEVSEWDTDRLGRPLRVPTATWTARCRLVRQSAPVVDPNVDGRLAAVYNCYLPPGTGIRDSDRITVGGRTFVPVALPDSPVSPFTGAAYELVSVRLVEDAT